jgi:hypothetical protein
LGQKISKADPAETPERTYDNRLGSADFPEWQCEAGAGFYGGFKGMPFHCQKAILQDFSRGLDQIYGFSNAYQENSPMQMAVKNHGTDAPTGAPSIPFVELPAGKSPNNLAMAKALQSTAKPKDKGKPKTIAEVNIPISFNDSLIESNNAEFGVDNPPLNLKIQPRSLFNTETADLFASIGSLYLDLNGECEAFLNNLLQKISENTGKKPIGNIRQVLENFRKTGLGALRPDDFPNSTGRGETGTNTIEIETPNLNYTVNTLAINGKPRRFIGFFRDEDANFYQIAAIFVHELVHYADGGGYEYSDREIIKAAQQIGFNGTIEKHMKDYPNQSENMAMHFVAAIATFSKCSRNLPKK